MILQVYDIRGNRISEVTNSILEKGTYQNDWSTERLPAGVYYYKISMKGIDFEQNHFDHKSMIIIK